MNLYNVIAVYDCFVVAKDNATARDALLAWIRDEKLEPSEIVSMNVTRKSTIRTSWQEKTPFVASDITDEEFVQVQGKTALAVFEHLYEKRG